VASSFEFGFLQTAVLSFVFVQHGYESVLSDSVFRIAIATVGCRRYGDLHALASINGLVCGFVLLHCHIGCVTLLVCDRLFSLWPCAALPQCKYLIDFLSAGNSQHELHGSCQRLPTKLPEDCSSELCSCARGKQESVLPTRVLDVPIGTPQ
jgi:hypothetical protein